MPPCHRLPISSRQGRGESPGMKLFTRETKLADAIHRNYLLIPVINRFGISLGFGDKTIKEVCRAHRLNLEFFLAIINVFSEERYFPEKKLMTFSALTILGYLQKTHAYYRDTQVPIIEHHLQQLQECPGKHSNDIRIVRKFFLDYKRELLTHLNREETVTFPYVRKVYGLYRKPRVSMKRRVALGYSMETYSHEHNNVDEKLCDLKNILIKYLPGTVDHTARNAMICEVFRLERDIRDHTRIEDAILMPLVADMEAALHVKRK
jgi:regulator of cell morphogenesis and NO signaling